MTFLHHSPQPQAASDAQSGATSPGATGLGKRRMSLFSFGLGSSNLSPAPSKHASLAAISTSPSSLLAPQPANKLPQMRSPSTSLAARPNQPALPGISPVLETDSLSENPDSHIFERSVQDMAGLVKQEDYIPPALDATAEILSDLATDLDNVEMVYALRRNSSVIGLNMALGRPYTPLRKNSVYLALHLNGNNFHAASLSSLTHLQPQPFQSASQPASAQQAQSPVSPPKLMSSRLSVSFYSYADMINNDEFSRRPSLMHAYSHGVVPSLGRKLSVASNHSTLSTSNAGNRERSGSEFSKFPRKSSQPAGSPPDPQSQLSKHLKGRLKLMQSMPKMFDEARELSGGTSSKKFLISPESSDSEDQEEAFHPASSMGRKPLSRRKSVASNTSFANSVVDNDSFVSSSVGDCIRKCTTEIENN